MERTKGKIHKHGLTIHIIEPTDLHYSIIEMNRVGTAYNNKLKKQEINANHIVYCWNAFEPDGPVDKLVKALEEVRDIPIQAADYEKAVRHYSTKALAAYRKDAPLATDGQVLEEKPE